MESDNWQLEQARREIAFSWTKEQFVGLGKVSFDVGFGCEIGWVVIIGAKLAYLFSEVGRLLFDEENCQLPILAELPRGISCPVVLERDRNFVETIKAVSGSRRWHQLFVVVMPFENKRIGIRPSDRSYKFVTHNCALHLWII